MHAGRLIGVLGLSGAGLLTLCSDAAAQSQAPSRAAVAQSQASSHAAPEPIDDNARYAWLDRELTPIAQSTERWYTGWTATFAWVTLGQFAFAATAPNTGLREVSIVGGINSALGLGAMLMAPNTLSAFERLHQFDASSPLGAWERRRRAEYLLHATAAEEDFYHSPVPLVLAAITSGIGALVLIRAYDQVVGGWATLGSGVGVTALQMLTRPSSAGNAWRRYVDKYDPSPSSQTPPDQLHLSFSVTPMGGAVSGTF